MRCRIKMRRTAQKKSSKTDSIMYGNVEDLAPWCALNRIFGFSPRNGLALIRHFGGAAEVFRAGRAEIAETLGAASHYLDKITDDAVAFEIAELEKLGRDGGRFICIDSPEYPALLKDCGDPPIGIYLKAGTPAAEIFSAPAFVAIVGTRDISSYGSEWCTKIVKALASASIRPAVVSGLAIGTDITAHMAALDNGLPTLAVMATGIDAVYPFRHGHAADLIAGAPDSGLLTDYPPGTCPKAINFLRRNRIIAGLCRAVILIESKSKGGGLLTCRLAYSYDRDVYALPGRIDDQRSAGCNSLIYNKMAEPITDLEHLISSLGLGRKPDVCGDDVESYVRRRYGGRDPELAEKAAKIISIIRDNRECGPDELCVLSGMTYRDVSACISMLEMDGIIVTDILRRCSVNPKMA